MLWCFQTIVGLSQTRGTRGFTMVWRGCVRVYDVTKICLRGAPYQVSNRGEQSLVRSNAVYGQPKDFRQKQYGPSKTQRLSSGVVTRPTEAWGACSGPHGDVTHPE
ncbi:hypothetical protein C2E23DRAFT_444634 [Lenzites betulinus]|nr:hypothetical protein C2E23DRAFT_444634 [Lenzites betulinus]